MRQILNLLAALAAIVLFAACEKDLIPQEGIVMTNPDKIQGTYVITGTHSYIEKTTKWLSTPPQGQYRVFFTNMEVNGNVCNIADKHPVFVGESTFTVTSSTQRETISVPVREITCHLSFKQTDGVKISNILVSGIPTVLFIDGEFDQFTSKQLDGDSYVVATQIEVSICIINELNAEMKVLKTRINAQPGCKYSLKVGKDNISISSE